MAELAITTILVVPVPRKIRNWLARKIKRFHLGDKVAKYAAFIAVALLLALMESVHSLGNIQTRMDHDKKLVDIPYEKLRSMMDHHRERKFRGQRNMYLAGFSLTLMFVISRLATLMQESIELEDECERLRQELEPVDSSTGEEKTDGKAEIEMKTLRKRKSSKKKN